MRSIYRPGTIFLLIILLNKPLLHAQADSNKLAITACLEDYISADADRVEKAFDTSASMKFIDAGTGAFRDVPIRTYIEGVRKNTNKPVRQSSIVYINVEGTAAQAEIHFQTEKFDLFDFMNLLKINGQWKIVSKIFSRKER